MCDGGVFASYVVGWLVLFSHCTEKKNTDTHRTRRNESSAARPSSPKGGEKLLRRRANALLSRALTLQDSVVGFSCQSPIRQFHRPPIVPACEWNIDPSPGAIFPNEGRRAKEAARHANRCQAGRISHLAMGRTDRGIMKLLTSKQAAESWADGGARRRRRRQIELQPESSWIRWEKRRSGPSRPCVCWTEVCLFARLQLFCLCQFPCEVIEVSVDHPKC